MASFESPRGQLKIAIENGNVNDAQKVLQSHPELLSHERGIRFYPLHLAVKYGHLAIVNLLLQSGNRDFQDGDGNTPLHVAARYKRLKIAERLLLAGSESIDTINDENKMAIQLAVANNCQPMVGLLLQFGSRDQNENGWTLFHQAANSANDSMISFLLQKGSRALHLSDEEGKTPLHLAAKGGYRSTVELILSAGSDSLNAVDDFGKTPLDRALESGEDEVISFLRSVGGKTGLKLRR